MNQDQQLWVYDRLFGIADGSLQRLRIRELRKMIRLIQGNSSILQNLSQSNLSRYINTEGIYGISILMILRTNNTREQERIRTHWINAARYAITVHSNNDNNNTRSINSKKSSGTKLSTPTRKRLKKTPTTPQSKLRKSPKK